jgi:hypothetical protein
MKFYPWFFATGVVEYTGLAGEARGDGGKKVGNFVAIA